MVWSNMGLPELKLLAIGIFTVGMLLDSSESKIFFSHHEFEKFSELKILKSLIFRTKFLAKLTNLKMRYETQTHISDGDFQDWNDLSCIQIIPNRIIRCADQSE